VVSYVSISVNFLGRGCATTDKEAELCLTLRDRIVGANSISPPHADSEFCLVISLVSASGMRSGIIESKDTDYQFI
jgi:hypothetical protein